MSAAFKPEHYNSTLNSVTEIIEAVVAKVRQQPDIQNIRYMHMQYGTHYIEGVPFTIADIRGSTFVSVYYCTQHMVEPEIIVLPLSGITSVRVPFHDFYKELLMKQGPWTQNLADAPARFHVERKAVELSQAWGKAVEIQWNGSEQDPAARLYVHKLIMTSEKLISDLLKDTLGAEALDTIGTVQFCFQSTDSVAVLKSGSALKLTIGLTAHLNRLESNLHDGLNKAL